MNGEDELFSLIENTRCLMNNIPGLVFIKSITSNFAGCSNEFLKLTQVNKKNIIGLTDYDLPWANYADLYQQRDKKVIKEKSAFTYLELMPIDKNTVLTVQVLKHPFKNSEGKILGVFGQTTVMSSKNKLGKLLSTITLIDKKNTLYSESAPKSYQISSYNKLLQLTPRESECLFLLVRGKSAKEIAKFLLISHRTVEEHVEHIKQKMNVSTRFELIAKAIETGMLEIIPKNEILLSLYKNPDKWKDFL